MSYTTVLAIYPGEKIEPYEEYHNSARAAPVVWYAIAGRYLAHYEDVRQYPWTGYHNHMDEMCAMYEDKTVPDFVRAVLVMTFDRQYVRRKNYRRACDDIITFLETMQPHLPDCNEGHWRELAHLLGSNPDVPAIGIWQTSVSENPYYDWDDEKQEYIPLWDSMYEVYDVLSGEVAP